MEKRFYLETIETTETGIQLNFSTWTIKSTENSDKISGVHTFSQVKKFTRDTSESVAIITAHDYKEKHHLICRLPRMKAFRCRMIVFSENQFAYSRYRSSVTLISVDRSFFSVLLRPWSLPSIQIREPDRQWPDRAIIYMKMRISSTNKWNPWEVTKIKLPLFQ